MQGSHRLALLSPLDLRGDVGCRQGSVDLALVGGLLNR